MSAWKPWFRRTRLGMWTTARRAKRFEHHYRQRREYYASVLQERGETYDEQATIRRVRKRIAERGYRPQTRSEGALRTFSVIPSSSWHPTLIREAQKFGPGENFDPEPYALNTTDAGRSGRMDRFNEDLLAAMRQAHDQQPLDWMFVYGAARHIRPDTLKRISEEFGLPTCRMCLDDKNCWNPQVLPGLSFGRAEIIRGYDLHWTSATVACGWYQAEGGHAIYLPEGADAEEYRPLSEEYRRPISFMGASYGCRPAVLQNLLDYGIPVEIFGRGWGKAGRFATSPAELFSESQINFGIGGTSFSESITNVKGRDFDVPCTGGGVYLTSYNADLARSFDIGSEILCYRSADEAVELARQYLPNPGLCRDMATRARQRCMREHLWRHRFARVCEVFGILPDRPPTND